MNEIEEKFSLLKKRKESWQQDGGMTYFSEGQFGNVYPKPLI